tara:strand:- start:262 stop:531 length:270 start_codon:yes stop_codon:yes gene_type:complete
MLSKTKRFIISSGSFNNVLTQLSASSYSGTAVTASCNWNDNVWCDITYTHPTSSAGAEFEAAIAISKIVWRGAENSGQSGSSVQDIGYV